MPKYDYRAARAEGHSDEEIGAYLRQRNAEGADLYIDRNDIGEAPSAAPSDATAMPGAHLVPTAPARPPGTPAAAPSDATRVATPALASPAPPAVHHGHETPVNPFGWMSGAGTVIGATAPLWTLNPGLAPAAPALAAMGAAAGTMADQKLNETFHTPFASSDPNKNAMGVVGNAALGAASEIVPAAAIRGLGRMVGPAAYKAALHVTPSVRDEFPGVNIPQEAWDRGAPRLNAEGVATAEEAIGRAARPVRARMNLANSRSKLGSVMVEGSRKVPAMVPKETTYEIGGWSDPAAGAAPTVDRLGPSRPPKFFSGLDYPAFPNAPGGRAVEAYWNRPPSAEQSFEFPTREPVTVPRKVLPMEPPQTVTHRVMVPGEERQWGLVRQPKFLPKITPSTHDLLSTGPPAATSLSGSPPEVVSGEIPKPRGKALPGPVQQLNRAPATDPRVRQAAADVLMPEARQNALVNAPGLQKLMDGVQGNLAGQADENEVSSILDAWLAKNTDVTSLSELYTLGQKAGNAGDWRMSGDVGGETARMATSPNFKLTGRELKLAINDYIDQQMQKAGVSGFREGNKEVQKTIAVHDAVREAGKVGPPRLNAENAAATAKWGAFRNPETLADFGRWAGGKSANLPNSKLARTLIRAGQGAAYAPSNAARFAPWMAQKPESPAHKMGRAAAKKK